MTRVNGDRLLKPLALLVSGPRRKLQRRHLVPVLGNSCEFGTAVQLQQRDNIQLRWGLQALPDVSCDEVQSLLELRTKFSPFVSFLGLASLSSLGFLAQQFGKLGQANERGERQRLRRRGRVRNQGRDAAWVDQVLHEAQRPRRVISWDSTANPLGVRAVRPAGQPWSSKTWSHFRQRKWW